MMTVVPTASEKETSIDFATPVPKKDGGRGRRVDCTATCEGPDAC